MKWLITIFFIVAPFLFFGWYGLIIFIVAIVGGVIAGRHECNKGKK